MKRKMQRIIKGNVSFNSEYDYSNVEEIKGTLDCRGADTKASFPKLSAVGGYLDCRGADTKASFPKLTKKGCGNAEAVSKIALSLRRKGFVFFDGILSFIKDTKVKPNGVKIHRIQIVGKVKISYAIEVNGVFSHGDTIREAKESLIYKMGSRDKSSYESWTLDTKITKREAIESYRVITGACESGVRHFVESIGKTKRKYTVKEIIEITKNQYGNKDYANFFARKN